MAWKIVKSIVMSVAALFAAPALTSCVDDSSMCPEDKPGYMEGNDVWLSFRVSNISSAERSGTRADGDDTGGTTPVANDDPAGHPEEASTAAENYIDPKDVVLMLLDNNDRIIKVFEPSEIISLKGIAGNSSQYELRAKVNLQYFDYAPGDNIDMGFMFIANLNGTGSKNFTNPKNFYKTAQQLSEEYYSFGMPAADWMPSDPTVSPIGANHIPMSGIRHYTISRSDLEDATDPGDPYKISGDTGTPSLDLMRAMAKIRVFDAIEYPDYGIESVSIKGCATNGAYLPDFETVDWLTEGTTTQMETATMKPDADWFQADNVRSLNLIEAAENQKFLSSDGKEFTKMWTGYLAEASGDMTLEITVKKSSPNSTTDKTQFSVPLKVKDAYGVEKNMEIVRNHIYEFIVTRTLTGQPVLLYYIVCPWRTYDVDVPPFD